MCDAGLARLLIAGGQQVILEELLRFEIE